MSELVARLEACEIGRPIPPDTLAQLEAERASIEAGDRQFVSLEELEMGLGEPVTTMAVPADPFFVVCLQRAAATPDFVKQFDRLTGHNLSRRGAALELEIDDATGRTREALGAFTEFVRVSVYEPLRTSQVSE